MTRLLTTIATRLFALMAATVGRVMDAGRMGERRVDFETMDNVIGPYSRWRKAMCTDGPRLIANVHKNRGGAR